MSETTMDKSHLATFVDGELSPEEAAAVVMHLADHPQDQAYVDELMSLSVMISAAYDKPLHEPIPDSILATIKGIATPQSSIVVPFRAKMLSRRRFVAWTGGAAVAASIAAFAFISNQSDVGAVFLTPGPIAERSATGIALSELATGETRMIGEDIEISLNGSFRTASNGICREFEVVRQDGALHDYGIACPDQSAGAGWRIEVLDSVALAAPSTSFTPASGEIVDTVGAYLDEVEAGPILTLEEEARARGSNWTSAD